MKHLRKNALRLLLALALGSPAAASYARQPAPPRGGSYSAVPPAALSRRAAAFANVHVVAFSADRKLFAMGDSDKVVTVRDLQTGKRVQTMVGHAGEVRALAFSPDGKILASGSDAEDDAVRLWDVSTGKELRKLQWSLKGAASGAGRVFVTRVVSLTFSPDGQTLASSGATVKYPYATPQKIDREYTGVVMLWDVAGGRMLRKLASGTTDIQAAAFSPDGKIIVSGTGDDERPKRGVKVWDAASGKELRMLADSGDYGGAVSVAFSPDGRMVAAAYSGSTRLWDPSSGAILHTLDSGGQLAFSPDGRVVVTAKSDSYIWNASTGEKLHTINGFSGSPNGVAFTPDGRTVLVGGWEGKFRRYDVGTGREREAPASSASGM